MKRHKCVVLLLCLYTSCFLSGVQTRGKSVSEENFEEHSVTIKLGALRITKKAIELRYEIRNGTEQDIWIFDRRANAKVYMDLKDMTLVVLRRINPPNQDKHSHFAQDIKGNLDHFFSGKDPDNPNKHRDEWDDACRDNIQLINRLQLRTNSRATPNNNERFER